MLAQEVRMGVTIERVADASGREAFFDFPERIYAGDPAWVPPLREWLRRRLSPSNPFFKEATLQMYVAKRGAEVVGTVSALRDPRWETSKNEKASFFGFFETVDDPEVSRALLATAADAAKGWGAEILRGPRNLTRVEDVGITVEGHDLPPPMLASHHRPYYQRLVEAEGFEKHHDVLAYHISLFTQTGEPLPLPEKLREKSETLDLPGLVVRQARWRTMSSDLTAAHEVFSEAFKTVPDTYPMPRAQFVNLGRAFLAFTHPRMMQLAFLGDRPIAFAVCLPELNEAVAKAHGHLLPFGWTGFLGGLRGIKTASFKLIGVLPEFRKSGVHARLIQHVVDGLRAGGYQRLEASLIDERNGPMRAVVEGAGMSIYRRYRIFDRRF
jgi:GNAT superfamily N-acetyltransferase